jgi:penicillin-binding protein 1C
MRRRLLLSLILTLFIVSLFIVHFLFTDLPSLDRLTENLVVPSTKILARDGRLLYEINDPAGLRHTTIPLKEIPKACQQATVAVEDSGFYSHPGVEVSGIVRAFWINLTGGEVLSGGSTITQQVARNVLLDPQEKAQRTYVRKLRESILAWRLSQAYSKDQILELYLNQTYYGHLAHGLESAAQAYFGKHARDLDLAECAMLAGIPQAPALFDPLTNPNAAKEKQIIVLDLMLKNKMINDAEAKIAKDESLQYAATPFPIAAPHFVFYVWSLLEQQYPPDVLYSGLTVTTTIDLDLTRTAHEIINRRLKILAEDNESAPHGATDSALVAIDPHTGQLLALIGSPNYFDQKNSGAVNMAISPRQPGSAIKPITYAAAFDPALCSNIQHPTSSSCPWTPATMILDVHTSFVTKEGLSYVPLNYDRNFHGPVSARDALGGSLNVPAVKALDHVGLNNMISLATRMGITTLNNADRYGLALTLGGGEVRLIDLTSAFGVFAAGGVRTPTMAILKITNARGDLIYQWTQPSSERILDERVAYLITDILSDNNARLATFGPNSVLQIGRPAAVKTGTTTDYRDNWTVGYTPELVTGVWVGNANNAPMINVSGVAGAGPIWHEFMRAVLLGKPESKFDLPNGLTRVEVCALSGLLPTEYCPHRRVEIFIAGTQPTARDNFYQPFKVDAATGALADSNTPPNRIVTQVFLVLPPEAQEWAREKGIPQLPVNSNQLSVMSNLKITSPDDKTVYKISPRLPISNQQILFNAVSAKSFEEVSFVLDGVVIAAVRESPHQTFWQLAEGKHTLKAVGVTREGEKVESEAVTFEVKP